LNAHVTPFQQILIKQAWLPEVRSFMGDGSARIGMPCSNAFAVLLNPPFGKKSSMSFTSEDGEPENNKPTYRRQNF
jgi:type I restriction enzyme M protein